MAYGKKIVNRIIWDFMTIVDSIKNIAYRFKTGSTNDYKLSYSQSGEDIIIDYLFKWLGIKKISYLDIGTNDPILLNNTYYFYKKGNYGVCIEPDPILNLRLKRIRPKDICLNIGVSADQYDYADYYVMSSNTLNTFSKEFAERCQRYDNQKIEKIIKIPLMPINDVITNNFSSYPNFISIDIEGKELEILKKFNFKEFKPEVFCIETVSYADYVENRSDKKNIDIINLMQSNGYNIYGDTYINSIFVYNEAWQKR